MDMDFGLLTLLLFPIGRAKNPFKTRMRRAHFNFRKTSQKLNVYGGENCFLMKKKRKGAIQQVDTDRNGGDERRAAEGFRDASLTL
jgi:hypothetical protein